MQGIVSRKIHHTRSYPILLMGTVFAALLAALVFTGKVAGQEPDDRNHQHAEGYAAGEGAETLHRQHHQSVSKNADDDRRHAVEDVRGKTDR